MNEMHKVAEAVHGELDKCESACFSRRVCRGSRFEEAIAALTLLSCILPSRFAYNKLL